MMSIITMMRKLRTSKKSLRQPLKLTRHLTLKKSLKN